MSQDTRYNGWANYATWRVNLEVFDGFDTDGTTYTDAMCREYVEDMTGYAVQGGAASFPMVDTVRGWVDAFLSDVDWREIANAVNEANGTEEESEGEDTP